jgi:DNA repair protein SbcC/Rad50
MIKNIYLSNFQSHKNSMLDLHAGINVITGSSDSGKTAILRALNWLATNKPAGDAFRSDWGGDTTVEIGIDESSITRKKTDKTNEYQISTGSKQAADTIFKAMGAGVPAEIEALLNLNSVNIQPQLSSPFLLSSDWSPGRVAEYLNEVVGLNVIDTATTNINAAMKKITADLRYAETDLAEAQAKHSALDYIDNLAVKVQMLEGQQTQLSELRTREQQVNNLLADINKIQTGLNNTKQILGAQRLVKHVIQLNTDADVLYDKINSLYAVITRINTDENAIHAQESRIIAAKKEWQLKAPDICPLCAGKGRLK